MFGNVIVNTLLLKYCRLKRSSKLAVLGKNGGSHGMSHSNKVMLFLCDGNLPGDGDALTIHSFLMDLALLRTRTLTLLRSNYLLNILKNDSDL